jgi:hypothetical protein
VVAGLAAVVLAVGLGTTQLVRGPGPGPAAGPTADRITISAPTADGPLADPQIAGLLGRRPDYGPLADPQRRASCLGGLGYAASTKVLGARPIDMNGRPGVLLVLPGDTARALIALVVAPNCSSADTGLFADTVVARP